MASNSDQTVPSDLKDRMKASYDAIAVPYNEAFASENDSVRRNYLSQLLQLLPQVAPEKACVLELGCGAGIPGTKTLLETKRPEIHVLANDLSSTQIDLARQRLGNFEEAGKLELRQGDMMDLEFDPASLDAVVAFYSIIHLPRTEQTELMRKIAKWLKPGGLLLANFSRDEIPYLVDPTWLGQEKGWTYWSGWGEVGSVKMVEEAGLSIVVKEVVEKTDNDASFLWVIAKNT